MELTYQKAEEKDWELIQSLETSAAKTSENVFHAFTSKEEIMKYMNESNVYLIYLGNILIGEVAYSNKDEETAYIDSLVITPEYQKKGYGKQAISWLLQQLVTYKTIGLVTHPHNTPAIIVYLKLGFKITDWKDNFFGDGEPRIGMAKYSSPGK